jgi:hypothetical protein
MKSAHILVKILKNGTLLQIVPDILRVGSSAVRARNFG